MPTEYVTLPTHNLSECNSYVKPPVPPAVVHLDDSALDVLLDFSHFKPLVVHPDQHMSKARELMEHRTLHAMLVLDEHNHFMGIITLEDILGSKPVQIQEAYRIERKELLVKHLMVAKDNLFAVDYHDLKAAHVGHVIKTLHELKQRLLFVTEKSAQSHHLSLRGLLVDTQISKQLGTNIREDNNHSHGAKDGNFI